MSESSVVEPKLTTPRPPCCALDLRALSLFRILFILFYLLEFIIERIPDLLSDSGCRHENIAPVDWARSGGTVHSIYFLAKDPKAILALLALTFVCCLFILVGYATTPAALLLMYLDKSYIYRNFMACDGHVYLMNRMFLAVAFTACDQIPINWSYLMSLIQSCLPHRFLRSSSTTNRSAAPVHNKYYYYDNSWGSALIYTSIIMLWLQIGSEKWFEWKHWFAQAAMPFNFTSARVE